MDQLGNRVALLALLLLVLRHLPQELREEAARHEPRDHDQVGWWREERGLDRLALHCLSIALPDPAETIVAPLEGSLADALRAEPFWAEALSSEPRLDLAQVDIRSGSRG